MASRVLLCLHEALRHALLPRSLKKQNDPSTMPCVSSGTSSATIELCTEGGLLKYPAPWQSVKKQIR